MIAAGAPVVRAEGLSRRFTNEDGDFVALIGVDLEVRVGEIVLVSGRSGAGKSTLLNLVGLLDRPDSGYLNVLGRPVHAWSMDQLAMLRRGRVGFLFQDAGLINRMTVAENVLLPLRYARTSRRRARVHEALADVGLTSKLRQRVETISGGERQRVGLARALAFKPKLLVCDEPSAALDAETTRLVGRRLRAAAADGAGVLIASHDPLLSPFADRRITLAEGRVVEVADACV